MGQIMKSLLSHCHSASLSVNTLTAAILIQFWWTFAQWFGARKVRSSLFGIKIWYLFPLFYPKSSKFAYRFMGSSKRYNSVPVKDNCALFAPTPLFLGPDYPMVSFEFLPCRPLLPWQRILGQITITRPP